MHLQKALLHLRNINPPHLRNTQAPTKGKATMDTITSQGSTIALDRYLQPHLHQITLRSSLPLLPQLPVLLRQDPSKAVDLEVHLHPLSVMSVGGTMRQT